MFEKLQKKWKVSLPRLILILTVFALGGSLCGYLARVILEATGMEKSFLWYVLYLLCVTLLWPVCVIIISVPFGQFAFFKSYLKKIGTRMIGRKN